ncbi:MAG: ABC transporter permease [Gemmatimonadota bacterium]|nr:MAG: ABC transporter permease [Gemmatimonadota bacterium]
MSRKRNRIPLLRLAWRNTHRNTRRTILTVSAIAVAVAALTFGLSYITGILGNAVDTYTRTESGHVRIRKSGYTERERLLPVYLNVQDLATLLPAIRAHSDVKEVLPRIRSAALVDGAGSNRPGLLLGIDLAHEDGYFNPSAMVDEGRLPQAGRAEVLIGRGFGEQIGVGVGDSVTVLAQTAYRSLSGLTLEVVGLAVSGLAHLDNSLLVVPLDQAQELADLPDAATEILVFATDVALAEQLAQSLGQELNPSPESSIEVLSWLDQSPLIRMLNTVRPMLGVIFGLLLVMAGLIIVNTMLMTVMERTQEFGMQAALGMRRSDIVALILSEGVVIGLLGGLIGAALGTTVAVWVESVGIDVTAAMRSMELPFQGTIYPDWRLLYTVSSTLVGIVTAGMAAVYPAWRAVRLSPAEALRV